MARAKSISLFQPALSLGPPVKHGAIAGLVAGLVFALFEIVLALATQSAPAFFVPLRMIGAVLLGPEPSPSFSLLNPGSAGLTIHIALSAVYGGMFGAITALLPNTAVQRTPGLLIAGSLFGLALWLANFYVIAPAVFPEFSAPAPLTQLVAHTVCFGAALGFSFAQLQRTQP